MIPTTLTLSELHKHLQAEVLGVMYPPGRKVQVALASYCIVADHHLAIASLIDQHLYASAFALSRPLYESALKGLWLSHCATESRAEVYARGKELDPIHELLIQLSGADLPSVVLTHLNGIKKNYWRVLSSFVHAGNAQIARWLSPDGIEPEYSAAEIRELMNFTAFFAVVAAHDRARLGGRVGSMSRIASLLPLDRAQSGPSALE